MPGTIRVAAALLMCAACASGQRTLRLAYPPRSDVHRVAPRSSTGGPTVAVALLAIVDQRPEPQGVLASRSRSSPVARVVTPEDPGGWTTGALRWELARNGVRVLDAVSDTSAPLIGGQLLHTDCDADRRWRGRVVVRAWLRSGSSLLLDAIYEGTSDAGWVRGPDARKYEECLALALQDAAQRIAADARASIADALVVDRSQEHPAR